MFLKLQTLTIRRMLRGGNDDGVALIAVIGVMAVLAVVALSISTAAISAATFSSGTRANVQARAAADAGIDTAWAAMTHGVFHCTVPTGGSGLEFEATVTYFDAASAPLTCSGAGLSGTPVKAVVSSIGVAEDAGISSGADGSRRAITALFDVHVTPEVFDLDEAVFSEGGFEMTNNFRVLDPTGLATANVYSNGNITCNANSPEVQGWILAQGNFDATNSCVVKGSVWAAGSISVGSAVKITGDVFSAGGTGAFPSEMSIGSAFIGGTVVANGNISGSSTTNQQYCSLSGYDARVCGSMISIDGTITLNNGARVGGGTYAKGTINIGNTHNALVIGGNVVSTNGGFVASASNGTAVGGYVAVAGASGLEKARIGNGSSSCAASAGFSLCNPANPVYPVAAVPAVLNFPTNTRVVAPPRQSLPRVNMYPDAGLAAKWPGWAVEHVPCANVKSKLATPWTGKLLLVVDGCIAPIEWKSSTPGDDPIKLYGDLAVMNPSGFTVSSNINVRSSVAGAQRNLLWIVPSDAKKVDGSNLATWTSPVLTDPSYTAPTCPSGNYGDVTSTTGLSITDTKMFIYTPCDLSMSNSVTGFVGQMYSGTAALPSNSTFTLSRVDVPGATSGSPSTALVDVTQTARFDARDAG
jgi:hypothetical protein